MGKHAILSPSGASRWLACTPSARLESTFPDQAGEAAREGTLAHDLGELLIKRDQSLISKKEYEKKLKEIKANDLYKPEMMAYCEDYSTYVIETFTAAKAHTPDAVLVLEQEIDLTEFIPEGFGTTDSNIIADSVLDVIDLKYGKGVPIDAVNNKQMMIYALGALNEFDFLYDIRTVRMTIYQPRIQNISTWEIQVIDLLTWAEKELMPRAQLAFDGEGEYTPGVHCMFCRAKATCLANAAYNLELEKYDFMESALLTDDQVVDILSRAERFEKWLKALKIDALKKAVEGKKWPGYKLVEGRSVRKYSDMDAVEKKLLAAGFATEIIFKPKELLGITAMQGELGKKQFDATLADLLIKPPGKPALVPAADKRPELNSLELAAEIFDDGYDEDES